MEGSISSTNCCRCTVALGSSIADAESTMMAALSWWSTRVARACRSFAQLGAGRELVGEPVPMPDQQPLPRGPHVRLPDLEILAPHPDRPSPFAEISPSWIVRIHDRVSKLDQFPPLALPLIEGDVAVNDCPVPDVGAACLGSGAGIRRLPAGGLFRPACPSAPRRGGGDRVGSEPGVGFRSIGEVSRPDDERERRQDGDDGPPRPTRSWGAGFRHFQPWRQPLRRNRVAKSGAHRKEGGHHDGEDGPADGVVVKALP